MDETPVEVKSANESDIEGVLDVQLKCSLSHKRNLETIDSELSKTGFIVFPLKSSEFKSATDSPERMFFVAKNQVGVQGYILAYDLSDWKNAGHNFDKVKVTDRTMFDHLESDKVLYKRHLASKPGTKAVASKLEAQLTKKAIAKGYEYIVAEIAKLPIPNNRSLEFHKRNGYEIVGEEPEGEYVWNIIMKDIQR